MPQPSSWSRCTAHAYTHTQPAHRAVCMQHTYTVSHQSDKQELSTRESQRAPYITFSEPNPSHLLHPSTGSSGKSPRTPRTARTRRTASAVQSVQPTTETKSRSPGGAGQVNQPQVHHRSKTSTSTNHLGAGVRYKQDQPEQNSVLLINKHTLASQKQSGYETLFASSSGY